ncbi:MAG: hypothetical protein A4E36_00177 [Methanoregulaceae archaeon PtaB.Bin009]|nr:MAG: hypothetical protein A4E36_00177 [Methanoregulaceae archaeon PtaB.Bin009]
MMKGGFCVGLSRHVHGIEENDMGIVSPGNVLDPFEETLQIMYTYTHLVDTAAHHCPSSPKEESVA